MRVFRISAPQFVAVALSGEGAARAGGRWNSVGVRLAYTASSVSLAMLEMLVHVDREDVPVNRRLLSYDIPDDSITKLERLPQDWINLPYSPEVRAVGDAWVERQSSLALLVPSAVARHESNILINPSHTRFAEIKLLQDEPLALDARLFP